MLHRVHRDGLGAPHRGDGRHHRVLVRRVLAHDRHVAVAPGGDVDQVLRGVPSQRVDAVAVRDRRDDLAGGGIDDDRRLAAARENAIGGAVVGDAGRAFARRQRPRRQDVHRFDVDHLDGVLAFVVDEDLALPVARRALRSVVLELGRTHDVAGLGVEGDGGADGAAVIGEDDAVGEVVVHDAVEAAGGNLDLLDHRQGAQVEHRHGRIAGAGDEAVVRRRGERDTVVARRVGDVAEHFAGRAVDHHHVRAARDEDAPRPGLRGQVVRAAVAADVELRDRERLRVAGARRGEREAEEERRCPR